LKLKSRKLSKILSF